MGAKLGPVRPFCKACGWRMGGPDSWDGARCKCGFTSNPVPHADCQITEGGGTLFTDDLWRCAKCGHEAYPETFKCQRAAIAKAEKAGG